MEKITRPDAMRTFMAQLSDKTFFEEKVKQLRQDVQRFDEEVDDGVITTEALEQASQAKADRDLSRVRAYVTRLQDRHFAATRSRHLARKMNEI